MQVVRGNIVNIFEDSISYGELLLAEGRIFGIKHLGPEKPGEPYITPPLVDAHVHIESSMVVPSQFARAAVMHGTLATVSDPHEIANVLGLEGVKYMLQDAQNVPFYFCFGAPSCVPATGFETAGAILGLEEVKELLSWSEIGYLAEMMNFPGVISGNPEQLDKIAAALKLGKPVDGHAPALRGKDAQKYFAVGIVTDHECVSYEEALEKIELGVHILIREGSAAKNFDALIPLAKEYPHKMMFCSDDKHPDELKLWHINKLVKRAINFGIGYFDALRMASLNPVKHYGLSLGLLREGEYADLVVWKDKSSFEVSKVYHQAKVIYSESQLYFDSPEIHTVNNFKVNPITSESIRATSFGTTVNVLHALDGQLITEKVTMKPKVVNEAYVSDPLQDCLKIVVINRYENALPAVGFVHGFGLKLGALASSVAHDSHNIVAVGVDDEAITEAINLIIREKGGISIVTEKQRGVVPLPVAGLMSTQPIEKVAKDYEQITEMARNELGSELSAPYMTLSFMALPVIPKLKMTDLGLFDVESFQHITLTV